MRLGMGWDAGSQVMGGGNSGAEYPTLLEWGRQERQFP